MTKILATISRRTPRLKGVDMIRINGAFGHPSKYKKLLDAKYKGKPVILDIPGDRKKHRHLTVKDEELIDGAIDNGIDYIGVSYVETHWDVDIVRAYCNERPVKIIAKVETRKAINNLDSIIEAADGIMIDREDLSNAIGLERVPAIQEVVVKRCQKHGKPVIIASQFLRSMLNSSSPTKAEVSDIDRGVSQGADYLMLSEETAIGKYAQKTVDVMRRIINARKRRAQAVILAAGSARGLGGLTADRHQSLLDCGGQTILKHQLDNLTHCGILEEDIIVVAGKGLEKMRKELKDTMVHLVYNPWFETTNMLASLWLAREKFGSNLIVVYGDIVFDRAILKDLLQDKKDAVVVVEKKRPDEYEEKVCVCGDKVVLHPDYTNLPAPAHKSIPTGDAFGEFIGLAKFSGRGLSALLETMGSIINARQMGTYLLGAVERMVEQDIAVNILQTKGRPWNDNDTLDDFKRTRKVVFPKIKKRYLHKR
ncbi:MAG: NTP transferase domain-containing protein [Candidatus Omnitrophica bacterium]|nr:NTP transferase domain-containing protein [Candidatus Omnitrophota bacterium]